MKSFAQVPLSPAIIQAVLMPQRYMYYTSGQGAAERDAGPCPFSSDQRIALSQARREAPTALQMQALGSHCAGGGGVQPLRIRIFITYSLSCLILKTS